MLLVSTKYDKPDSHFDTWLVLMSVECCMIYISVSIYPMWMGIHVGFPIILTNHRELMRGQ